MTTHPADSRGLRLTARPPGADEPVRVYDVLVVTPSEAGAFEEFQAHPPAGDPPAELGRGLSIQQLASDVAELVMNACELRGHSRGYLAFEYGHPSPSPNAKSLIPSSREPH